MSNKNKTFENAQKKTTQTLKSQQNTDFSFAILPKSQSIQYKAPLMRFFEYSRNDGIMFDKCFVLYKKSKETLNKSPNFRFVKQMVAKNMNMVIKKQINNQNYKLHTAVPLYKYGDRHAIEILCDGTHLHLNLYEMFMPHLTIKPIKSKKWNYSKVTSLTNWFPMSQDVDKFINEIGQVVLDKIPVSYLLLSEYDNHLHIDFGYTYEDSRKYGYSTLMRKMVQFYALENNMQYITTYATKWGSQIASKKAGFFQLPMKPRLLKNSKVINKLDYNGETTHSRRQQTKLKETFQKALKTKRSRSPSKSLTHKNEQVVKSMYRTGTLPLNIYGNGNKLNGNTVKYILKQLNLYNDSGTSSNIRKVNKSKLRNLYNKI